MAIAEVKKEPTAHEIPTVYEETVLNKMNKPPTSKVSRLFVWFKNLGSHHYCFTMVQIKIVFSCCGSLHVTDKGSTYSCSVSSGGSVHVPGMWQWDC